jgi:uncharacterized protein
VTAADVLVEEATVATQDRGFASMDRDKQREIASKGGKAAHQKGSAHEWTPAEAREAGRKGGVASHRKPSAETPPASGETPPAVKPEEPDTFSYDW